MRRWRSRQSSSPVQWSSGPVQGIDTPLSAALHWLGPIRPKQLSAVCALGTTTLSFRAHCSVSSRMEIRQGGRWKLKPDVGGVTASLIVQLECTRCMVECTPINCFVCPWPSLSPAYPTITYTHPTVSNFCIKPLVAKQWPQMDIHWLLPSFATGKELRMCCCISCGMYHCLPICVM